MASFEKITDGLSESLKLTLGREVEREAAASPRGLGVLGITQGLLLWNHPLLSFCSLLGYQLVYQLLNKAGMS